MDRATEDFVRGLIHSDGRRVVADDRGVKSIRYHFTNHSEDILGLFTSALDLLGIPWTRSTKYVVSIYRKAATARLDEFIGPKSLGGRQRLPRHVDQPVLLVETELGMAVGQCDPQAFRYLLDLGPAHITPSPHTAGRDR